MEIFRLRRAAISLTELVLFIALQLVASFFTHKWPVKFIDDEVEQSMDEIC
jgi:hypothetical protein